MENKDNIIPLNKKDTNQIIFVNLDNKDYSYFLKQAKKYKEIIPYSFEKKSLNEDLEKLLNVLDSSKTVIVAASGGVNSKKTDNYGISKQSLELISSIQETKAKKA